jgi:hypothetical protein
VHDGAGVPRGIPAPDEGALRRRLLDFGSSATAAFRPALRTAAHPLTAAFSTASQRDERTSDAPCRAPREPGNPSHFGEPAPARFPARQSGETGRAQSAFPRQCSPKPLSRPRTARARHRRRGFATTPRLPAHVRRPTLARGTARPTSVEKLFASHRGRPCASCRLLQSNESTGTTKGRLAPRSPVVGPLPRPARLHRLKGGADGWHFVRNHETAPGPCGRRAATRSSNDCQSSCRRPGAGELGPPATPRAIARAGWDTPPSLARTPRVARSLRGSLGLHPPTSYSRSMAIAPDPAQRSERQRRPAGERRP